VRKFNISEERTHNTTFNVYEQRRKLSNENEICVTKNLNVGETWAST